MGSYEYPEPKDIVWHKSGALDGEGLSEEWITVCHRSACMSEHD